MKNEAAPVGGLTEANKSLMAAYSGYPLYWAAFPPKGAVPIATPDAPIPRGGRGRLLARTHHDLPDATRLFLVGSLADVRMWMRVAVGTRRMDRDNQHVTDFGRLGDVPRLC